LDRRNAAREGSQCGEKEKKRNEKEKEKDAILAFLFAQGRLSTEEMRRLHE